MDEVVLINIAMEQIMMRWDLLMTVRVFFGFVSWAVRIEDVTSCNAHNVRTANTVKKNNNIPLNLPKTV